MPVHKGYQAASAALAALSAIIEAMAPGNDVRDVTLAAWSIVHGYTSLCVEAGLEGQSHRRQRADLFARAIESLNQRLDTRDASPRLAERH